MKFLILFKIIPLQIINEDNFFIHCILKMNEFYYLVNRNKVLFSSNHELCFVINFSFSSNSYKLKIHTRTHTGQLPYKCKYCDRRTLTRCRLKDHERTHTKEKPFICNICGKVSKKFFFT